MGKKFNIVFFLNRTISSILTKKKLLFILTASVVILFLLLWISGVFSPKIPEKVSKHKTKETISNFAIAHIIKVPITETAVGTVQSVHEVTISSKLTERVTEINVKAGQTVRKGDILLQLDDSDLRSKLQQATSNVVLSEASKAQAIKDEERARKLVKYAAISKQEYENKYTKLKTADAELKMAQAAVKEIQSLLHYATITSPINGIVIDKKVEVGDTVVPGQVLLKLYDQKQMQIIANVRESLTYNLKVGQQIEVQIDALNNKICSGTVSEIVPEASSPGRSFQVKVTGPCPPGIYSGMFGRIIIPLKNEEVLVIPDHAVKNVGQLQLVNVIQDGSSVRRNIRTGRQFGDSIEVLSGLREGEKVIVPFFSDSKR